MSLSNSSVAPLKTWQHPAFMQGVRDLAPAALGIAAWGFIAGIAMIKTGMGLPMAIFMNLVVYAGSAQLAVVPLMAAGAPMWVIWAAALCVNLRFIIFSASLRPYLGHRPLADRLRAGFFCADLNTIAFLKRFPTPPVADDEQGQRAAWAHLWGTVAVSAIPWHVATFAGMVLGERIPPQWGIGFAGTVALVGLACSLIVDRTTVVTALVAGAAAVATWALPLKLNIVVAIAVAVALGAVIDHVRTNRGDQSSAS